MSPAAVDIDQLDIRFGDTWAVRGISLLARAGEITAVLGPNGAGKSSLLNAVCTTLVPSGGRVRVFGHDTRTDAVSVRRQLGVIFQEPTLDPDVRVDRNLWYHGRLYGMSRARTARRTDALLTDLGLHARRRDRVQDLSGGLARRVEIARALMHEPRLLVLDEPTTGLDPDSRRRLWRDLLTLRTTGAVSVLFSTHYMDEAEYADRIVFVNGGRVVLEGSPLSVKASLGASRIDLHTTDDRTAVHNLLRGGFVASADTDGVTVLIREPERAMSAVIAAVDVPVLQVSVRHPSLDDVFLAATGRGEADIVGGNDT